VTQQAVPAVEHAADRARHVLADQAQRGAEIASAQAQRGAEFAVTQAQRGAEVAASSAQRGAEIALERAQELATVAQQKALEKTGRAKPRHRGRRLVTLIGLLAAIGAVATVLARRHTAEEFDSNMPVNPPPA